MIHITLPDGSQREFPARSRWPRWRFIGAGLAKARWPARSATRWWTPATRSRRQPAVHRHGQGCRWPGVIRHSTAHLLAYAVKELFPDAQVTIGPVIENGFYYDFSYKRPFTPEDLVAIEKRMTELAPRTSRWCAACCRATRPWQYFKGLGEHYKAEIIASIPSNEDVSLYREGSLKTCAAARTCRARASSSSSS
jgi:threonyl-tRNA synthetase